MISVTNENPIDQSVRSQLVDWPYISHYLQATLDHELIGSHGEAILYRALNVGRLVAFVSSGVSMSYGRISWSSLVRSLVEESLSLGNEEPATDTTVIGVAKRLRATLRELNITDRSIGDDLQSGRFPAAFQFCEQLWIAKDKEEGRLKFRNHVKKLLFDDQGHAEVILQKMIGDLQLVNHGQSAPFDKNSVEKQTRAFFHADADPGRSRGRGTLYDGNGEPTLQTWRDGLAIGRVPDLRSSRGILRRWASATLDEPATAAYASRLIAAVTSGGEHRAALPTHRFLVAAVARLGLAELTDPGQIVAGFINLPSQAPHRFRRELRAQYVPPEQDPLAILSDKLKIGRFITTNFDLDVEQLIADRGFYPERRNVESDSRDGRSRPHLYETANPLGATAADTVFDTQQAVEMIDFAVNEGHHAFSLMHLHGRAAEDDDLVVTERDYMNLYLRRGPDSGVVSDALDIGFGSNPLLFVGNGMGEDDILRPLRQFVSERSSDSDRQAVALLPAMGSKAREIEETIAIYSRYGVHTVHFGFAELEQPRQGAGFASPETPVRWLELAIGMAKDLKSVFAALGQALVETDGSAKHASRPGVDAVRDAWRTLGRAYNDHVGGYVVTDGDQAAKPVVPTHWLHLLQPRDTTEQDLIRFRPVLKLEGVVVGDRDPPSTLEPKVEVEILTAACQTLWGILRVEVSADGRITDSLPDDLLGRPLAERRALHRIALAYAAALDGLPDALISLSLSAKLNALHQRWMDWKQHWYALPVPRMTGGPIIRRPARDKRPACAVFERHPIALRQPPGGGTQADERAPVPDGDRFFAGSPSKVFSTLFAALRAARDDPTSALSRSAGRAGRRIFVLLGARGIGKGHFFEAMRAEGRLDALIAASWPKGQAPVYGTVVMLNLSLSMEVASAFDRIANVLVRRAEEVFPAEPDVIEKATEVLKRDRIGRLARVLELYGEHSASATSRVMVAISGFSVLFNRGGLPKNGQAARLLEALLGSRSTRAPIDLVLVCDESGFPDMFRDPRERGDDEGFCKVAVFPMEHLVRPDIDDEGRRLLAVMIQKHRVAIASGPSVSGSGDRVPTSAHRQAVFFHVLHIARASLTVGTYFPLVSLALAAVPGGLKLQTPPPHPTLSLPGFRERRVIQSAVIERLKQLTERADLKTGPDVAMTFVIPEAMVGLVRSLRHPTTAESITAFFKKAVDDAFTAAVKTFLEKEELSKGSALSAQLSDQAERLDGDFKHLFHLFDHNRFILTLACAAASEAASLDDGDGRFRPLRIVDWFRDVARTILGLPSQARAEATIEHILRFYGSRHDQRSALPDHCGIPGTLKRRGGLASATAVDGIVDWLRGPKGWRLQQSLLWHLAVCSQPVEADVLASAPKVVDALTSCRLGEGWHEGLSVAVVEAALDLLVHRCLVFRLWGAQVSSDDARADDAAPHAAAANIWRFTLHRLMQSLIYLRLHAPAVEFHVVDPYTLSLYGLMPNDLPRPRAEVIQDLDALISAWTGFPRDVATIDRDDPYHTAVVKRQAEVKAWTERHPPGETAGDATASVPETPIASLPSRLLRAAYGVIRSVYSVGVVSRFDDFGDRNGPSVPVSGYFEQHRLQIQWLIQKAVDLSYADGRPKVFSGENHGDDSAVTPFYAEEIVWLYNECGLLSLIEGRLNEADDLFGSALAAARRIEVDADGSPLRTRITLNSALVDLERGRVGTARRRFGSVERQTNEHPAIRAVAGGYVGVCAHVNGDFVTAKARYDAAIGRLRDSHHARGVAIFSRHLADLLRASGPASADAAYTAVEQSIAHAQGGGHEDIQQNARLSRVRIDISRLPSTLHSGRIQTELDGIERYGQVMGMPRLACEVSYARATFLLSIGETQHATTLARRSLRIATQHDLKLRQVSGLALMARIYEKRGLSDPAAALFTLAKVFANLCDYRSAHFAISNRSEHLGAA